MVVNTLDYCFFLVLLFLTIGTFWLEINIRRGRWVKWYNMTLVVLTGYVFPDYSRRNELELVFNSWGDSIGEHDSSELWYPILQYPLYWVIGLILITVTTSFLYFRKNSFK